MDKSRTADGHWSLDIRLKIVYISQECCTAIDTYLKHRRQASKQARLIASLSLRSVKRDESLQSPATYFLGIIPTILCTSGARGESGLRIVQWVRTVSAIDITCYIMEQANMPTAGDTSIEWVDTERLDRREWLRKLTSRLLVLHRGECGFWQLIVGEYLFQMWWGEKVVV